MSLNQNHIKIKLFLNIFIISEITLILVSYLHVYLKYNYKGDIVFERSHFVADFEDLSLIETGKGVSLDQIVASKNGVRYYYQNCPGLNRIKAENRVYFSSEDEAEKAGYSIAKNCKKP